MSSRVKSRGRMRYLRELVHEYVRRMQPSGHRTPRVWTAEMLAQVERDAQMIRSKMRPVRKAP